MVDITERFPKMKKQTYKFKEGDKVTTTALPGIWELVWYKDGDDICAIQNSRRKMLAKVSGLRLASSFLKRFYETNK